MDWLHELNGATLVRLAYIFGLEFRNREIKKIPLDKTYQQIEIDLINQIDWEFNDDELPTDICPICNKKFKNRVYLLQFNLIIK